jgi:hypothetical protein
MSNAERTAVRSRIATGQCPYVDRPSRRQLPCPTAYRLRRAARIAAAKINHHENLRIPDQTGQTQVAWTRRLPPPVDGLEIYAGYTDFAAGPVRAVSRRNCPMTIVTERVDSP